MIASRTFFATLFVTFMVSSTVAFWLTRSAELRPFTQVISIPKGDLIPDQRSPEEACLPYLENIDRKTLRWYADWKVPAVWTPQTQPPWSNVWTA